MSIQGEFIRRTLKSEGERFLRNQGIAIRSTTASRSGNLINNRSSSVSQDGPISGTLTITHPIYERFLDMKVLRYGKEQKKVRNKRQLHNRFVFGHYHMIARKLMYGLTDEVVESIKNEIEN